MQQAQEKQHMQKVLTKKLIESAINNNNALTQTDYYSREQHGTYSLCAK